MKYVLAVLLSWGAVNVAVANEVHRWVDANGQVHFTDAQLAPASAQRIKIARANPMDVTGPVSGKSHRSGRGFVKISKAKKRNKDGWQGHSRGRKGGRAR